MSEQTTPIAGPMAAHSTAAATPDAEIMDHQNGAASTEGADKMEIDGPPAGAQVSETGDQNAPAQQLPRGEESTPDAAQVRQLGGQSASASQSGGETAPSPAQISQPGVQGLPPVAQTSERGISSGTAPGRGSQSGGQNLPPAAQDSQAGRQNATDAAEGVQPGVQNLPPGAQKSQPGGQTAAEAVRAAAPRPRGRPPGSKVEVCLQCAKLKFWVCPDCCKCQEKLFKNGKWGGGKWCQVCTNRRRERNKAVAEGKFPYPQRTCDCTPRRRCDYHLDHMCGECADQGIPQACPKHCKCGSDGQKCDACLLKQDIRFRTNKEKAGCGCMSECPLCISCTCKKTDALCGFCKGGFDKGFLGDKLDPLRKMKPLPVPQNAIPATADAPFEVRVYFPSFHRLFFLVSADVVRGESVRFRNPSGDPLRPTIPTNQEIDILYHYFPDIRCERHRSLIYILDSSDGGQLASGTYTIISTRRQSFVTAPTRVRLWPFEVVGDTGWQTVVLPEHLSFEKWLEGEEERNGLTFNCRYKGQKVAGDAGGSAGRSQKRRSMPRGYSSCNQKGSMKRVILQGTICQPIRSQTEIRDFL
jgi:hypothetical protein